jgi:FAD/FMN-containing dehydrogenase
MTSSPEGIHVPDLFWALRGGGGNFGVVTAMRVRLHPISSVLAGVIMYPWHQARDVFHAYNELAPTMPDELTSRSAWSPDRTGTRWCTRHRCGRARRIHPHGSCASRDWGRHL